MLSVVEPWKRMSCERCEFPQAAQLVYELADPEYTAMSAERLDERRKHPTLLKRRLPIERLSVRCHLASRVFRDGLCHGS